MLNSLSKKLATKLGFRQFEAFDSETVFKPAGFLTLGTEVELQLLNPQTLNLAPFAPEMLEKLAREKGVKKEFFLSTLEAVTAKQNDAHGIKQDLEGTLNKLTGAAADIGIKLASTACHPFSKYSDCIISPSERYSELIDRNQWLTKRMTVYGLHVHIGLRSGDECINYINFLLRFIPHLLALSASSPFWQGEDTGLASCRPTTYEALPTAGLPYWFNSWAEFEHLHASLKQFKSIENNNDLWWDIRPSPKFGTLEVRVCDGVATLTETIAITTFIHLLAHWFSENSDWMTPLPQPNRWILRENKWRAIRYGLDAEIITNPINGIKNLREDITEWADRLKPYAKKLGYEQYLADVLSISKNGNSSARQRKVFERSGNLKAVVEHNVAEFLNKTPIYD